jgi:DHA1 family tetracycline resistance protein-like MFS transporter
MVSNNRSVFIFIILTVLIDTIGLGIIFPVLPKLITTLGHTDVSTAAKYGGWLSFVYAAMQFVFAPILGNLSDAYGRRPVLLCALLGFSIDYLFLAFAPDIFWLFIGRMISGITGASAVVGASYMADISTGEERTKNFGILNATMGLGFILGPALGGVLCQFGTHIPFMATAMLGILNLGFGYFVLPESLADSNRRPFEWGRANPFGAVKQLSKFPSALLLITSILFLSFANHSIETVWAYFTIEKFGWSEQLTGFSICLIGALFIVAQAWLVGVIIAKIKDRATAYLGLLFSCAAFLCFAFTSWQWGLVIGMVLLGIGSIAETALQGMLSNRVSADEQGELQGSLGCLKAMATFIAPLLMANSFAFFTGKTAPFYFPGMPFVISAVATVISLLLLVRGNTKTYFAKVSATGELNKMGITE